MLVFSTQKAWKEALTPAVPKWVPQQPSREVAFPTVSAAAAAEEEAVVAAVDVMEQPGLKELEPPIVSSVEEPETLQFDPQHCQQMQLTTQEFPIVSSEAQH